MESCRRLSSVNAFYTPVLRPSQKYRNQLYLRYKNLIGLVIAFLITGGDRLRVLVVLSSASAELTYTKSRVDSCPATNFKRR